MCRVGLDVKHVKESRSGKVMATVVPVSRMCGKFMVPMRTFHMCCDRPHDGRLDNNLDAQEDRQKQTEGFVAVIHGIDSLYEDNWGR